MKIAELRDKVAASIREQKETWLADLTEPDEMTDVRNIVHGYRGNEPVVMLIPMHTDRDDTLLAARTAAVAFGCDTLSFTSESWHPAPEHALVNPYTGKSWGSAAHSMQTAVDEHDALAQGVVIECLMTTVVNRAGDLANAFQDYKITQKLNPLLGRASYAIEWGEPMLDDSTDGSQISEGIVPKSLVAFMNEPTMRQRMARSGVSAADYGINGEVATQAHLDCATVKFLVGSGKFSGGIILLSDDPKRTEIIERSLGELRESL